MNIMKSVATTTVIGSVPPVPGRSLHCKAGAGGCTREVVACVVRVLSW
jgi:hypothetical protein